MRLKIAFRSFSNLGCKLLVCVLLIVLVFGCKQKDGEVVFRLREISAFQVGDQSFRRGQVCICSQEPDSDIKAYPVFKSDKPLYGSVRFARVPGEGNSGIQFYFAIDESNGTGNGYDRIYFDINHDFDLTNDISIPPLKNQPNNAFLKYPTLKEQVCFDYLNVNFDFGSNGQRPLEIMPRLMIYNSGYFNLDFVTTKARTGTIKISGRKYNVLLGHNGLVSGWFDNPWTALHLIPKGRLNQRPRWDYSDRLLAMHKIEGTYYSFSATPAGDKLIARPYHGSLGTFMGDSGERDLSYISCSGSLCSENRAVAVGGQLRNGSPQPSRSCQLPVGDYYLADLMIQFDDMRMIILNNYHADGAPRGNIYGSRKYGIKIREDKPFIFDFSDKPEVLFALPAKNCRIKRGDQLMIKAVLTVPELDILFRSLDRMEGAYGPDGTRRSYQQPTSLDPNVVITRADGEKIAEGVMPFG